MTVASVGSPPTARGTNLPVLPLDPSIGGQLAKALGVTEERQLRAIEAAALLHDMGKLAIPEFILNKPGKLTAREFSVMKTHAAVGADLLSSIQFPYPVVPIVRHHHENWDGTGYPDGIRGADIAAAMLADVNAARHLPGQIAERCRAADIAAKRGDKEGEDGGHDLQVACQPPLRQAEKRLP